MSVCPQCFLNAVLQCLSSTRPLRDFCLRRDFRQEVPGGGRAQELTEGGVTIPLLPNSTRNLRLPLSPPTNTHSLSMPFPPAFADVIGALWHPDSCEAVNPTRFRAVFQKYVPSFSGYRWELLGPWGKIFIQYGDPCPCQGNCLSNLVCLGRINHLKFWL